MIRTIMGYINVFFAQQDFASAQAILRWGIDLLSGLEEAGKPSFLDKMNSVFFVCLAHAQLISCENDAAYRLLLRARELAECFDAAPAYDANAVRFVKQAEQASVYDNLGTTAIEDIQKTIDSVGDEVLSALWKEGAEHEK